VLLRDPGFSVQRQHPHPVTHVESRGRCLLDNGNDLAAVQPYGNFHALLLGSTFLYHATGHTAGDCTQHGCHGCALATANRTSADAADNRTRAGADARLGSLDHDRPHVFDHAKLDRLRPAGIIPGVGIARERRHAPAKHEQQPGDNNTDIEIVTAPTALLLRSTGDAYPESSAAVYAVEMDTELAMEIATAPAADSTVADAGAGPGMIMRETTASAPPASGDSSSPFEVVTAPASNLINRDSSTAWQVTAESAIPEPGVDSVEEDSDSPRLATMAAAALDSLPAAAAGAATTASDAASQEATDEAGEQAFVATPDSDTPARDMDPVTPESPLADDGENAVVAMAEAQPVVPAPSPAVAAASPAGDWVVNLASYTYEAMARKKLAIFKAKGVNGEIERTTVNDKPLYRIRVTGFESSRAARASIPDLQKTLGLEGAWIARR